MNENRPDGTNDGNMKTGSLVTAIGFFKKTLRLSAEWCYNVVANELFPKKRKTGGGTNGKEYKEKDHVDAECFGNHGYFSMYSE